MSSKLLQGFLLGPWRVEPLRGAVTGANSEEHHVEPKVMDVFVCLADRGNELATRTQLLNDVWSESAGADEQLTRAIGELRRVLNDNPGNPTYIETVPKRGYRLIADVQLPEDMMLEKNTGQSRGIAQHLGRNASIIISAALTALLIAMVALNVGDLRNRLLGVATPEPIASIAVLPLSNLSGDPEQEYFTDGMTEALTAELGQISGLKVISRTSAMQFKVTDMSMPEIAAKLAVDALMEGSVLRVEDEVRITLQLIHGPTDRHLWSRSFQRDLGDILALQSEVAGAIAEEIQITMSSSQRGELRSQVVLNESKRPNPQAYDAYLKGRFHFNQFSEGGFRTATRYFKEAIALDPTFALAYAAIGGSCPIGPIWINEILSLEECEQAALKAIGQDDKLSEAHAALGVVRLMQWNWAESEVEFKRAIDLNPNSVMARQWYAELLRATMRVDESLREIRFAEELDPLNLFVKTMVGWPLMNQGRFDEALAQLDDVLEMDRDYGLAHYYKGLVYILLDMPEEVLGSAARFAQTSGEAGFEVRMLTAAAYAIRGEEKRALEVLAEVEQEYGSVAIDWFATIHMLLGKDAETLALLEKAYDIRWPELPVSVSEPFFDDLRDHPEFQVLRRKMGLP